MKVELKHIAPYLPYGLKVASERGIKDGTATLNNQAISHIALYVRWNELQPILRPLSDLTKEIEHNGEKFVPIEELKEIFIKDPKKGCDHYREVMLLMDNEWTIQEVEDNIQKLPFEWVSNLFEWHFDVFDLIEKGLAININTLIK